MTLKADFVIFLDRDSVLLAPLARLNLLLFYCQNTYLLPYLRATRLLLKLGLLPLLRTPNTAECFL